MRYIRTKDLKLGMVVERPIYSAKNNLLINRNTAIRDIHLKSLIENNYKGAYIKDDLTNDVIVENPIPENLKNEAIVNLQDLVKAITELGKSKLDKEGEAFIAKKEEIVNNKIDFVINVAKKIAKDIYYNNEVNFDLFDLQGEGHDVIANSIATTELSVLVGRNLNYNLSACEDLAVSALLNDIGKYAQDEFFMGAINFSESNINNLKITGEIQPYNDDYHSLYSYLLLSENRRLSSEIRNTILLHNEREDMEGPLRRKPYSDHSKIISIADVYVEVVAGVRGHKFACPKEARLKL